jgi:hypothetical protein
MNGQSLDEQRIPQLGFIPHPLAVDEYAVAVILAAVPSASVDALA